MGYIKTTSGAALACAVVAGATIVAPSVERTTPATGNLTQSPSVNLAAATRALSAWSQLLTVDAGLRRGDDEPTATSPATAQDAASIAGQIYAAASLIASSRTLDTSPALLGSSGNSPARSADASTATATAAAQDPAAFPDQIDDSFIDSTFAFRTGLTPVLNQLGFFGKQIYIGVNLLESLVASLVFNGTDVLRGENLLQNLGDVAVDAGLSVLFVAIDEYNLVSGDPFPVAIVRPPNDRPLRWQDAAGPLQNQPLTVPDRGQSAVQTARADDLAEPTSIRDASASDTAVGAVKDGAEPTSIRDASAPDTAATALQDGATRPAAKASDVGDGPTTTRTGRETAKEHGGLPKKAAKDPEKANKADQADASNASTDRPAPATKGDSSTQAPKQRVSVGSDSGTSGD